MSISTSFGIHGLTAVRAKFASSGKTKWLDITFVSNEESILVGIFPDDGNIVKLTAIADAINAAFSEDGEPVKPASEPETDIEDGRGHRVEGFNPDDIDF